MPESRKFDRNKFNTDPSHEKDREEFDTMVEDSISRVIERKKKDNPDDENMWDRIGKAFFGGK